MEIRKTRTSVRNPKGNGQVEKFIRTLVRMIKAYLKGEQKNWDLNLGCLAAAFRATPSASTKFTSNMLMLVREVRIPGEIRCGIDLDSTCRPLNSYDEYVDRLCACMQVAHDIARKHLEKVTVWHKYTHDVKIEHNRYENGESVWYLHKKRVPGISPKLQPAYLLCVVLKRLSDGNYLIGLEGGSQRFVHHDKLKKYEGGKKQTWMEKAVRVYNRSKIN